jgi:hypothetical protein
MWVRDPWHLGCACVAWLIVAALAAREVHRRAAR